MSIDRALPIPAYYQIAVDLRRRIAAGEWAETTRLPTELALADEYRVSRSTLRQALQALEGDGLVIRQRPTGTFINPLNLRPPPMITIPISFVQTFQALGYAPRVDVRAAAVQARTPPEIAAALGIGGAEEVAYFERLFSLDGRLLAIVRSVIPHRLCPDITRSPLLDGSVHATLATTYGVPLIRADHEFEAVRATNDDETDLAVEAGSPLMILTSVYFDAGNRPVEHVRMRWIGEAARLHLSTSTAPTITSSFEGNGRNGSGQS